jgi:hypothetical protein
MTSKRLQVLTAVHALVSGAAPGFDVRGFTADAMKPERIPADGMIIGDPGDPGEPEMEMSPLAYIYTHRIPVEVLLPVGANNAPAFEAALDDAAAAIGAAVIANRTLSGLCQFLDVTAATFASDDMTNAIPVRIASFDVVAEYVVNNPLGA